MKESMKFQRRKKAFSIPAGIIVVSVIVLASIGAILWTSQMFCADCNDRDLFMTLQSVTLYSGSASSLSNRGTAVFTIDVNNPGYTTGIIYLVLTGISLSEPASILQCSNETSCAYISTSYPYSAPLSGGTVSHFDTNTTAFYVSQAVRDNESFNYVVNFANGQSVSGVIISQPPQVLPAGPKENYSTTVATTLSYNQPSSSSCASTYATTRTINSSGTLFTTGATIC